MEVATHDRGAPRWREIDASLRPLTDGEQAIVDSAPRFTQEGWRADTMPADLFGFMTSVAFEDRYVFNSLVPEETGGVVRGARPQTSLVAGGHAFGDQRLDRVHRAPGLVGLIEAFAGVPVEPTFWYGPRLYLEGAVLDRHIDRPLTHLVSATVCISSELRRPWPILVDTGDGFVEAHLQPGDVLLYEGVRLPHFRPFPIEGEYVGAFFHYRPRGFDPEPEYRMAIEAAGMHEDRDVR